jgi:hypothetical protein
VLGEVPSGLAGFFTSKGRWKGRAVVMFRIDKDRMRVLFTMGDRDLAIEFARMEGYAVVPWSGGRLTSPLSPVTFGTSRYVHNGTEPEQVSPGVYSYKIALPGRKTYAQGKRRGKRDLISDAGATHA